MAETFPAQQLSTCSLELPVFLELGGAVSLISRQWATEVMCLTSGSKLRKGK